MTLTRFEFTDRVSPVMEVGIGSTVIDEGTGIWDVSLWDAAGSTWNGDDPLWRDVSCDVIDAHIELGRGRITDSFPVGTADITADNLSGWADPSIGTGDSPLQMRPGRGIRVGVNHVTFGTRWLFRGFIDAIEPVDDPADWATVRLRCIDAFGEAGRAKLTSSVETGASEVAHTRFARILNTIQWPSTKRDISTSAIQPLYAAELDGQVVDLLRQTADSAGGWAFGDLDGNVVLRHRDWLLHEIGDPADATIGNMGGLTTELLLESGDDLLLEQGDQMLLEDEGVDVCPGRWERSFDRADITTRVILDRDLPADTGPFDPIVANDLDAQVLYGIEPFERSDLWTRDNTDLAQIAYRIIGTRAASVSMPRIKGVTVDAGTSVAAVDLLSTLSVYTPSRYRGRLQTARGTIFDDNYFAVGVTHDLSAEAWTADISLDLATPFELLDPVDYVWDTALWDRSLWN